MEAFTYHVKTEIVFGAGSEKQVAELAKKYGASRILVVYGGGSAVRSGLLDRICKRLKDAGLVVETFGGVRPNPRLEHARKGVEQARAMGADLILAVGGGSVVDTAKAIAHGTANPETDIWEFWMKRAELKKTMPVGVVLTIPAAGSETSDSAVLTDEPNRCKRGINTDLNRPVFAILDPALAATLPKFQVACGVTDIMMHTLDRYFNPITNNEITDAIAEALLRVVIENGPKVYENPADLHAMSEIMWCGSLSHNGLTGLGGKKDFAVHQLGHAVSARYDMAHGESLSRIWKAWALEVADADNYARFARFGRNVWGIQAADDKEAALQAIERQNAFFQQLDMPVTIRDLEQVNAEELTDMCSYGYTRTIGTFKVLDADRMRHIYEQAMIE